MPNASRAGAESHPPESSLHPPWIPEGQSPQPRCQERQGAEPTAEQPPEERKPTWREGRLSTAVLQLAPHWSWSWENRRKSITSWCVSWQGHQPQPRLPRDAHRQRINSICSSLPLVYQDPKAGEEDKPVFRRPSRTWARPPVKRLMDGRLVVNR